MSVYSVRDDQFQIIGTPWCVPFALVKRHAAQCQKNHGQSPERLRERGGLSWCELYAVITDQPWQRFPDHVTARRHCIAAIEKWAGDKP
jgi:hypothetical protein